MILIGGYSTCVAVRRVKKRASIKPCVRLLKDLISMESIPTNMVADFSTVSDDEFRALRHHVRSPPGSPRSLTPPRSPGSRRRAKTLSLSLRPPIIIEKGPRGYGFTLQAIRVYFGDTNYYRVHHLVSVSYPHLFVFIYTRRGSKRNGNRFPKQRAPKAQISRRGEGGGVGGGRLKGEGWFGSMLSREMFFFLESFIKI